MGFSNQNLLYLLFLVPLLILLYVLRLRRKVYNVPSSILWEQDVEDIKANTLFQRLRKNLLLPLQLLVLVLIIFTLSRPFIKGAITTASDVILLLDTSASMNATDIDESRFGKLRSTAISIIDELGSGTRMTLIESGISPKLILGPTSDKFLLKDAVMQIKPSDVPTDLNSAIQLASSISANMGITDTILMSDSAGRLSDIKANIPIRFISFGKENANNVGIIGFDVLNDTTPTSKNQVFVSIKNFGKTKQSFPVTLYYDNALIDARNLTLMPQEQRPVVFDNVMTEGILMVSIDLKDDLLVDNKVWYVLQESRNLNILLVSEGNTFIEKAIQASSLNHKLSKQKPEDYMGVRGYDVAVFDSFMPKNLPDCNAMFMSPEGDFPFAKLLSKKYNPVIIGWDKSHQIMRFIDLSELKIDKVNIYEMPSWMKPLADADISSVMWYGENKGRRIVILPFSLDIGSGSNFPLLPAFPIFISNTLSWLARDEFSSQNKTGKSVNLPIPGIDDNRVVSITKPDGIEIKTSLQDGRLIFADTDKAGIYQVNGTNIQEQFAVNLLNESESDIKSSTRIRVSGQEVQSADLSTVSKKELWTILAFIALILIAVEWWVYHRRVLV
jgi:Ca-activated chloride channel family protein